VGLEYPGVKLNQSRRAKRERFINWLLGLVLGSCLFIWTLAYVAQDYADHLYGYDLQTLRPTPSLVASFLESVHASSPDHPKKEYLVKKWVKPASISLIGKFSDWHRREISRQALLLQKLTGLEIKIASPEDRLPSIKIFFVQGKKEILRIGREFMSGNSWNENYVGDDRCFLIVRSNVRKEKFK